MVKAFKNDAAALKALKRWKNQRPGAYVTIDLGNGTTLVKLHGLPCVAGKTLRGAARLALADFEKRDKAKTIVLRKHPLDHVLGLGA